MGIFRGMFLTALMASMLFGCAKERTVEEYENEKALDKLAKFQAAQGLYSGVLFNQKSQAIGAIEINIVAKLDSSGGGSTGSGGTKTDGGYKAVLTSELHFKDLVTRADLRTESGYYDPDSGIYQADFDIPIKDDQGKVAYNRKVSITGNLGSGTIRGTMQGVGFATQVTTFTIRVGGGELDKLSKSTKPAPGAELENMGVEFSGSVKWPAIKKDNCKPKHKDDCMEYPQDNIDMTSIFLVRSAAEHFANLFLPDNSKSLQVNLSYGSQPVTIAFGSAQWDTDSGFLIGESQFSSPTTGGVTRHLLCRNFHLMSTVGEVTCDFWTDRTKMAKMVFKKVSRP